MNRKKSVLTMDTSVKPLKDRLWYRAACCGPYAGAVVEGIWVSYLLDGLEHGQRFLRLADTYSSCRLENACHRAIYYGQADYRTVKRILRKGADTLPLDQSTDVLGESWDF